MSGVRAELLELLRTICETPAPTFHEERRARLVARLWRERGLEPEIDGTGNVVARAPVGSGPRVLLAAHLDTVFGPDVEVRVRERQGRWSAPGIGDNSASLAVLTCLAEAAASAAPASGMPRLTLAATVGEEGLGDLRGMRGLLEARPGEFDLVVAIDGNLGTIVTEGVGSRRLEMRFSGPGGHSWGDFPAPSAVHAMGSAISAVAGIKPPREPRSTLNVGQAWGGTSINAIAERAGFNLDLRSLAGNELAALERAALQRCRSAARRHGVELEVAVLGERPAGRCSDERLVVAAREALAAVAVEPRLAASSTDANVAMAAGLPAIAFGVYLGGDAHRQSEWLDPDSLSVGYRALAALLERLGAVAQAT